MSLKRAVAKRLSNSLGADLSTAADGACDVPADAVDKSFAAPDAVVELRGHLSCSGSRSETPLSAILWLLWTTRSRIASASVGSSR